ncbi:hypothetical protein FHX35_001170 [Auritidibacter ignavus]|nr:hypothetical protein [Auritidibacter ignavus]
MSYCDEEVVLDDDELASLEEEADDESVELRESFR